VGAQTLTLSLVVAIVLVQFSGPSGTRIDINPAEVTSVRDPHAMPGQHYSRGTGCIIVMANGKFISVNEDCSSVRMKISEQQGPPCDCK
jgi:hypothetical protein